MLLLSSLQNFIIKAVISMGSAYVIHRFFVSYKTSRNRRFLKHKSIEKPYEKVHDPSIKDEIVSKNTDK